VATFSVRAWLASAIGCDVERLALVLPSGDGRDALFALDGEPCCQVHLMGAPGEAATQAAAVVAAWPGGSANTVVKRGSVIEW
jgi:hypothetical protein